MDEQKLRELEGKIKKLEDWKAQRERQQIVFPLDFQSQQVLGNYFMRILDVVRYVVVGAASEHTVTSFFGSQAQYNFEIPQSILYSYTVNTTTDVITASGGPNGRFEDDTAVYVYYAPDGVLPAPLASNTQYYVRDSTGLSFKLTDAPGNPAIDITTTGTGRQLMQVVI